MNCTMYPPSDTMVPTTVRVSFLLEALSDVVIMLRALVGNTAKGSKAWSLTIPRFWSQTIRASLPDVGRYWVSAVLLSTT